MVLEGDVHREARGSVCTLSHSVVSDSFVTQRTVAHQPPLSMGFSRQEYWRRLPFPIPGDLPDLRIKLTFPVSPALAGGFFTTEPPGKSLGGGGRRRGQEAAPSPNWSMADPGGCRGTAKATGNKCGPASWSPN